MFVVPQCAISNFLSGMSKFLMGKSCLPEPVPIEMLQGTYPCLLLSNAFQAESIIRNTVKLVSPPQHRFSPITQFILPSLFTYSVFSIFHQCCLDQSYIFYCVLYVTIQLVGFLICKESIRSRNSIFICQLIHLMSVDV